MKRSQYTDSQILNILKQAESGIPVPNLCREHGIKNLLLNTTKNGMITLFLLMNIVNSPQQMLERYITPEGAVSFLNRWK